MKMDPKKSTEITLVRKSVEVVKDGQTRHYTNYYLRLTNGSYVAIKPAFENDYKTLYVLSEEVEQKG